MRESKIDLASVAAPSGSGRFSFARSDDDDDDDDDNDDDDNNFPKFVSPRPSNAVTLHCQCD